MTYQAVAFILGCTGLVWAMAVAVVGIIVDNEKAAKAKKEAAR